MLPYSRTLGYCLLIALLVPLATSNSMAGGPATDAKIDVKTIVFVNTITEEAVKEVSTEFDVLADVLKKDFGANAFQIKRKDKAENGTFGKAIPATLIVATSKLPSNTKSAEITRDSDCPNNSFYTHDVPELAITEQQLHDLAVQWTRLSHESVGGLSDKTKVHKINKPAKNRLEVVLALAN